MTASTPAAGVRERPGRPDDGLFGPDSVTWRVMGQPVIWIAALRALYLQALHPRMMMGTLNTLAFASLPRWARRLYGTPGSRLTDVAATAALRAAFESTSRLPPGCSSCLPRPLGGGECRPGSTPLWHDRLIPSGCGRPPLRPARLQG